MATPISGDRIPPQRDVNPSPKGRAQQAGPTDDMAEKSAKPAAQDSLQLKSTFQQGQARPLSEAVQDAGQARDKLARLLGAMRDAPSGALAAQGNVSQRQVDTLLNHSV